MWKLSALAITLALSIWMPILLSVAGIALATALMVAPSLSGEARGIAAG